MYLDALKRGNETLSNFPVKKITNKQTKKIQETRAKEARKAGFKY